ncbi:MAG: subclass B1 metallo-beta-lactamase [Alteromonadaceae bacterium]|nr:subclass B1 metallo-beta-lactamase [Alteromonadaceae bacterium]
MKKLVHIILIKLLLAVAVPVLANSEIEIKNIKPGVWVHTSYYTYPNGVKFPSNGLIFQQGDGLVLVDTAWGELATVALLETIKSQIKRPVIAAIVTHAHADRLAGTDVLKSNGIAVYAHPLTIKYATEYGSPVPDKAIDGLSSSPSVITLGNVEVLYPGPGHTTDNLMVWLPQAKIFYGGCAVRAKGATSIGNTAHSDVDYWRKIMKYISVEYQSAEIVIPGHGEMGDFSLISNTLKLVSEAAR